MKMSWNSNSFEFMLRYKSPGSIGLLYSTILLYLGYSRILFLESGYILTYLLWGLFCKLLSEV
jgi:hypothetical protein